MEKKTERNQEVVRERQAGLSIRKLAKKFQVSPHRIQEILAREGKKK